MFCWFERGGEFLRYEARGVSTGTYQLAIVVADGTERVEHFTDAAARPPGRLGT
jgi:hypothetical protein